MSNPQELFARFASRYGLNVDEVGRILKNTAFKVTDRDNPNREATDEQLAALLIVADQYNLNPFVKEIYAFPDSNGRGIVPTIPIDGYARIANEHPQYNGVEFHYSEELTTHNNKKCPTWIEAVIYRKDRTHPTRIREYLDECAKGSTPWNTHPRRMLRHKAFMQCARVALSFGGIYDEDEAERIASARIVDITQGLTEPIDISETLALPMAEQFEAFLLDHNLERNKVEAYVKVCAHHFGSNEENVQAEIIQYPERFFKSFPAWVASVEHQKQAKAEGSSAPAKSRAAAKKQPEQDTAAQPPVDDHPPAAPKEAQAEQASLHEDNTIYCPKAEFRVPRTDCANCKDREGCPSLQRNNQ